MKISRQEIIEKTKNLTDQQNIDERVASQENLKSVLQHDSRFFISQLLEKRKKEQSERRLQCKDVPINDRNGAISC